ncbi:unnamed protein product [Amoebophrya sp. A120]|nr:unnamed protein product [Amoebophrya sp. A120]|eukprot:GSA120T00007519001.1
MLLMMPASPSTVADAGDTLSSGTTAMPSQLQKSAAHRFCQFAMNLVNRELEPLFESCIPYFEQAQSELNNGQGETLEQYSCYQKYIEVLEQKLTEFVKTELNYDTEQNPNAAAEFLQQLQAAMEKDKEEVSREFEQFLADYKQQVLAQFGYNNDTDGVTGGAASAGGHQLRTAFNDASDDDQLEEEVALMRMLFKPESVEDLFHAVLNMTEYSFFSQLMRERVRQKQLEQKAKEALQLIENRKRKIIEGEFGLAFRFVEFAVELLNDKLYAVQKYRTRSNGRDPFYHRTTPLFDQDYNQDNEPAGRTLKDSDEFSHLHYAAFKEYEEIVETELRQFILEKEQFPSVEAFFVNLQDLIAKDEKNQIDNRLIQENELLAEDQLRRFGSVQDLISGVLDQVEFNFFAEMMRFRAQQEKVFGLFFRSEDLVGKDELVQPTTSASTSAGGATPGTNSSSSRGPTSTSSIPEPEPIPGSANLSPAGSVVAGPSSTSASLSASSYLQMTLLVPENCLGGSTVAFETPDGQNLTAVVPEGLQPGAAFTVEYQPLQMMVMTSTTPGAAAPTSVLGDHDAARTSTTTFTVQVPENCGPGTVLLVTAPSGQQVNVEVPAGVVSGMNFEVSM